METQILSFGTGRRKSSNAQVQLLQGNGQLIINTKPGISYFQENNSSLLLIQSPFQLLRLEKNFNTIVKVEGGGLKGQAEAIQLGIARALCNLNKSYRSSLKIKGYLTFDARCKERKKYGLKKARKAPQYSKR